MIMRYDTYAPQAEGGKVLTGRNHPEENTIQFDQNDILLGVRAYGVSPGPQLVAIGPLLPIFPGSLFDTPRYEGREPLTVNVSIFVKRGTARIDAASSEVGLAGGAPLRPSSITRSRFEVVRSASAPGLKKVMVPLEEVISAPAEETKRYPAVQDWANYDLVFDVAREEVTAFELRLPSLEVNSQTVTVPPIKFSRRKFTGAGAWP